MYSDYTFGEIRMKTKKILLASLLLLVLLTVSAASAADSANLMDSGDPTIQAPEKDVELDEA